MKRLAKSSAVILLGLVTEPFGCGGNPSGPSSTQAGDFPSVRTTGNPLCSSTAPTIYMIAGLYGHVIDPTAPSLVASMRVGEEVRLGIVGYGCGWNALERWISTDSRVGAITASAAGDGRLRAASPGETQIYADFEADDNKTHRTTLAYCPGLPGAACPHPRKIDVVRVVPR